MYVCMYVWGGMELVMPWWIMSIRIEYHGDVMRGNYNSWKGGHLGPWKIMRLKVEYHGDVMRGDLQD